MSPSAVLLLFLLSLLSCIVHLTSSNKIWPKSRALDSNRNDNFPSFLFNLISNRNEKKNVGISPFSIQSALTLLYMGAEGDTAKEFQNIFHYSSSNKNETAADFLRIIKSMSSSKVVQLTSANRIYTRFDLVPEFNEIALKFFQAEAEVVDFKLKKETANKINTWVEDNTNKKITNLISPDSIDDYTTAMLVNAIYFKAQWVNQFNKHTTSKQPFFIGSNNSLNVDTMSGEITCKYASFPDLDATAIEMKYEESNMVMDVILPNKRDGLQDLQRRLSVMDLGKLFENITEEEVDVKLPRFKIEFDTELIPVLEEMGMKTTFKYGANFKGIFNTSLPVKISEVIHKAFIDVNEFGSEAAASTYTKIVYLSGFSQASQTFTADHPFMFVIRNPEAVYFIGHVKHFDN